MIYYYKSEFHSYVINDQSIAQEEQSSSTALPTLSTISTYYEDGIILPPDVKECVSAVTHASHRALLPNFEINPVYRRISRGSIAVPLKEGFRSHIGICALKARPRLIEDAGVPGWDRSIAR